MADWLFDKSGRATLILDDDCIRDPNGLVVAWISGGSVHTLGGAHCGWFEDGVVYDSGNRALAFVSTATGLSRPGLAGAPGMPGFAGKPGKPGLSGVPGRPGRSGWSAQDAGTYFMAS